MTVDELAQDVIQRAAGEDSLARLTAAVSVAEDVRDLADEVLDRFVSAARAEGRSWSEIGAVLGVTKQAAQQRYVPPNGDLLALAGQHAYAFRHRYIGTEHLLAALVEDPGLAGATLAR